MPLHDWTKVDAGAFHGFHTSWLAHLKGALNGGILPPGYYADAEQIARSADDPDSKYIGDILALRPRRPSFDRDLPREPGIAVSDHPPRTRVRAAIRVVTPPRRHLVVRHKSGHHVVALIEVVSPSNKDRLAHLDDFAGKVVAALSAGVHVLILDLFPPGRHDPNWLHEVISQQSESDGYDLPAGSPRTFASYVSEADEAYLEHPVAGDQLPEMPLFLTPERYVNVPLEPSYQLAWRETPYVYKEVLDPQAPGESPSPS